MTKHKIRIESELSPLVSRVFLDGEEIKGIRNVSFSHPVGELPIVVIEIIPLELIIEGESEVQRQDAELVDITEHGDEYRKYGLVKSVPG